MLRPSTRALSLVATGEQILRQELRAPEPGAVVARRNWGAELQNFVFTLFFYTFLVIKHRNLFGPLFSDFHWSKCHYCFPARILGTSR